MRVCIWTGRGGSYWDTAEDSGGVDRVSPQGPFPTDEDAMADAYLAFAGTVRVTIPAIATRENRTAGEVFATLNGVEFLDGVPIHYGE